MSKIGPLLLIPEYHERVWGGQRLRPSANPIGEAWIVYERNCVASGPEEGRTLAELADRFGSDLLGSRALDATGLRFPLLIKLLDAAEWLSLQVHPNNEQARRLEGEQHFGKTEAWHILEAEPGARVISGLRKGTTREDLATALRAGTILDLVHYCEVKGGDTIFTAAGTIHALGPGLLLYEVQQTSDLTYRVWDWNRPLTAGRELHVEKSLEVSNLDACGEAVLAPKLGDGARHRLCGCAFFQLDLVHSRAEPVPLDTAGETFHAITIVEGTAEVTGAGWSHALSRFESLLVPAAIGAYEVRPRARVRGLVASVE